MGLFRSRARKNREKVAAERLNEQATLAQAQAQAQAQADAARREVASEARPNPDLPGWGQSLGQEIGKIRDDSASPE